MPRKDDLDRVVEERLSFTVARLLVEMSPAEAPMHLCHDHFGKTLQTLADAAR